MIPGATGGGEVLFSQGKQLAKLTSEQVPPARIGGKEFAIIVDGLSEPELHALAQSILDNARTILINHQAPLSISIGVGTRRPAGGAGDVYPQSRRGQLQGKAQAGVGAWKWAA